MMIRNTFRFQLLGLAPALCDITRGILTSKKGVHTLKTACLTGSVGFVVHNLYHACYFMAQYMQIILVSQQSGCDYPINTLLRGKRLYLKYVVRVSSEELSLKHLHSSYSYRKSHQESYGDSSSWGLPRNIDKGTKKCTRWVIKSSFLQHKQQGAESGKGIHFA